MEDKDVGLICMKLPVEAHVPGFVGECDACGARIHISYSGHGAAVKAARERGGDVVTSCLECAGKRGADDIRFTDEQVQQVEELLGRKISPEERARIVAEMKAVLGLSKKPDDDVEP